MNTPIRIKFDIESSIEEFKSLFRGDTQSSKRKKLTCATDMYFTRKIQENTAAKCALRSNGISVKKIDSRKKNSPAFNGKFSCKFTSCPIKFRIVLQVSTLTLVL
jgi:hypothetical protein